VSDPTFRNISDTALWAAMYRAGETERRKPLFRDPYARRLAGTRGAEIAGKLRKQERNAWAWVIRTFLFDHFISAAIAGGADTIINLAAGLDARPYRMNLPPALRWVEVDLPPLLAYKEEILRTDKPSCRLERIPADLADRAARQKLFERLDSSAKNALVITEGLLIYLTPEDARAFADDLAERRTFHRWVLDVVSPGLLRMMQRQVGAELDRAHAPLQFAPEEGPEFFTRSGWKIAEVRSTLKAAVQQRRVPWWGYLFALFPEPKRPGKQPWSAACLLTR
jgi:methyltransferase (TIGR00027 family)